MRLKELIEKLQQIQTEHPDQNIDLVSEGCDCDGDVKDVEYCNAVSYRDKPFVYFKRG